MWIEGTISLSEMGCPVDDNRSLTLSEPFVWRFAHFQGSANFKSTLPDAYTKVLARQLMKQLRDNWRSGDIDMALAKTTTRVPLLKLVDFDKTVDEAKMKMIQCDIEEDEQDEIVEQEYEFRLLKEMHSDDHRTAMVQK